MTENKAITRTVFSQFNNCNVTFIDDCGCKEGGFIEEELTQHGFHGASWWAGYRIRCGVCNKILERVFLSSLTSQTKDGLNK